MNRNVPQKFFACAVIELYNCLPLSLFHSFSHWCCAEQGGCPFFSPWNHYPSRRVAFQLGSSKLSHFSRASPDSMRFFLPHSIWRWRLREIWNEIFIIGTEVEKIEARNCVHGSGRMQKNKMPNDLLWFQIRCAIRFGSAKLAVVCSKSSIDLKFYWILTLKKTVGKTLISF